jgi:hypothetical protein
MSNATEETAKLAHISVIDPGKKLGDQLTSMFKTLLKDKTHDALGELAVTLIQPQDAEVEFNGGAWIEGFDRVQIPHTHQDDGRNASERYLLVFPVGANGVVDILPKDGDGPMERYLFEKDKLHLLHFDGASPHRFSIMGGKNGQEKGAKLYAVAVHSRDVATSMDALIDQTDIYSAPFPKWSTTSVDTYPPQSVPEVGTLVSNYMVRDLKDTEASLPDAEKDPDVGRKLANVMANIALHTASHGTSYGNVQDFGNVDSLRKWTEASVQVENGQHVVGTA